MLSPLSKSLGSLRRTGAASASRGCIALGHRSSAPRFGASSIRPAAAAVQTEAPPSKRPVVRVPLKDVVEAAVGGRFAGAGGPIVEHTVEVEQRLPHLARRNPAAA